MIRNGYKRRTNWMIFAVSLLVFGYLIAAESGADVESSKKSLSSVQKRLIADGFDPTKIKRLYSRPQVSFEADGVILLVYPALYCSILLYTSNIFHFPSLFRGDPTPVVETSNSLQFQSPNQCAG